MEYLILLILIFTAPKRSLGEAQFDDPKDWCPYLSDAVKATYPDCAPFITSDQPSAETAENENELPMNETLFEGDILGIDRLVDDETTLYANAIRDEKRHWKDAVVFYRVSPNFRDMKKINALVKSAIKAFEDNTCLQFRKKTTRDKDFISIAPGTGCSSYTGFQGGTQQLNIDQKHCMTSGIIQHELMHAVGFYHEQSRTDRDDYVDINWDNIDERNHDQFKKYTSAEVNDFGLPYDFNSVLHYKRNDFAIDPKSWTIRPKQSHEREALRMGQRDGLSPSDIKKINALYNCTKPAPCPDSAGWEMFKDNCYFFSFIAGKRTKNWIRARNFCQLEHGAMMASASNEEVRDMIQSKIKENRDKFRGAQRIWLNDQKTIDAISDEPDYANGSEKLHFVCLKPYAVAEASFVSSR